MIITPNVFSKIKRKSFFTNAPFSCKFSFQVSPKSFKSIYMISLTIAIFAFTMFYQPMDIAFGSNTSVTFPSVRINYRTTLNPLSYKEYKGFSFNIWTTSAGVLDV